jgi:hypothetical protein
MNLHWLEASELAKHFPASDSLEKHPDAPKADTIGNKQPQA